MTLTPPVKPPCRARVRRLLPGSPKEVKGKAKWLEMERLGIIERIQPHEATNWSSALHIAPKDGTDVRICGDFRPLNNKTTLDHYPLPNLKDFTSKLLGCTLFTRLDLKSAFFQIPLSYQSSLKTVTLTPWGAWRYTRLPMGLRNSAQSLQRLMDHVFYGLANCYVYMDDLLLFSKDQKSHDNLIKEALQRLDANGLSIHLDKCSFGQSQMEFLGYQVTRSGITPLDKKVSAICDFPAPRTPKDLLGFLGALNFYRRSLPKLDGKSTAEILDPLYKLASRKNPGKKFVEIWQEMDMDQHYNNAKRLLMEAAALSYPDPGAPIALTTDASLYGIGATLEQFVDGSWQPLGYFSKLLGPGQRKWSTYKRELYAIQQAVRYFHEDINGRHLIVWCDHRPIVHAFKGTPMPFDPVAENQLQEVSMWTSDVRFLPGKVNTTSDLLSRPPGVPLGTAYDLQASAAAVTDRTFEYASSASAHNHELAAVDFSTIDLKAMADSQASCEEVQAHRQGKHPPGLILTDYSFGDVVLYADVSNHHRARPLVPKQFRTQIMGLFHHITHPGQKETVRLVAASYYWPTMRNDVAHFVKTCPSCQAVKTTKHVALPPANIQVPAKRFSQVQLDIVGPLETSFDGYRYLLTVIDRTTRYADAYPLTSASAENCCRAFIDNWISRFGLPHQAVSDNGNVFISKMWKMLHERLGVMVQYTPVYHPASLGHLERAHRDIKYGLKTALLDMGKSHGQSWTLALPWCLLSRRVAFQPDLGASPIELVMGDVPTIPGDLAGANLDQDKSISDLLERLRTNAAKPPVQTSHHGTPKVNIPQELSQATHVYTQEPNRKPLGPAYQGPYPIVDRPSPSTITIRVGSYANGTPKTELRHWDTCKVAHFRNDAYQAEKPRRGRPRKVFA